MKTLYFKYNNFQMKIGNYYNVLSEHKLYFYTEEIINEI